MRYLGLALFAEGPSDHAFLSPVLSRLCTELCVQAADALVEVGPMHELHSPEALRGASREERILEAARAAQGEWTVLFVHADGGGDPDAARVERTEPAAQRIAQELGDARQRSVAVIPVRETEAWVLADGEAVRAAFGTRRSEAELGLPRRPRDVEGLQEPKQAIENAFRIARGDRMSRKERAVARFALIGERTRLDVLSDVPAFRALREELVSALEGLHYLRPAQG